MKKSCLPIIIPIVLLMFLVSGTNSLLLAYPSGSPAAYTGSPGDGQHCQGCHGGSNATVNGWITTNIPTQGYTPGTVYTITATVSGTGKKGFEVSPQNISGAQLGILAAGTNNHLVGGTKYVTQNSSGSSSGTVVYNFTWTAPVAGTGSVTFYGAFTVGKSNTKLSTTVVGENAVLPLAVVATASPGMICSGQTSQLNATASGGSGIYTYSWTSIPVGFTSSLQNPVVSPSVSTQYIVLVSDGVLAADAPANVDVVQPPTANAGSDTTCAYITTQVPMNGIAGNYTTFLWTASGTGTFSAANALSGFYYPSAADKTAGNVTLTLTAAAQSPCSAAASDARIIHFDGPTGLGSAENQFSMVVSPNPSTGRFLVRLNHGLDLHSRLRVIDVSGRVVLDEIIENVGITDQIVDLTGYPKGAYFVKINGARFTSTRKVFVQ